MKYLFASCLFFCVHLYPISLPAEQNNSVELIAEEKKEPHIETKEIIKNCLYIKISTFETIKHFRQLVVNSTFQPISFKEENNHYYKYYQISDFIITKEIINKCAMQIETPIEKITNQREIIVVIGLSIVLFLLVVLFNR